MDWTAKYSTAADDLLREDGFCLFPAAPIANYLDSDASTNPSMTVDHMGKWSVIIEGANTYSPDPNRKIARARMERAVYRERGVLIATDYLVNSGGVIFAAQEHLIKTPDTLRIPAELLGDADAVDRWLAGKRPEFDALAEKRLSAAEEYREEVIRRNMRELVDLLITDADMLPCEAAERISIRRIAASESDRTAAELLEPIPSIESNCDVQRAAALLIKSGSPILAIVSKDGGLVGVVTEWDITQATAQGCGEDRPIKQIMTRELISVSPDDPILEVVQKLEHHEISAMPVVEGGVVYGMISTDLLARRSLLRLLQSHID
jgi:glutamate dehydrogenase (NAD(P)+)